MQIVNVIAAKGGVGTSTTAAMIAVSLATTGSRVVVLDTTGTGDVSAIVADGSLTIAVVMPTETEAETIDFLIVDHAVPVGPTEPDLPAGINLLVTTNDYLAVRRSLSARIIVHALVILENPDSHLVTGDVHAVLGIGPEQTLVVRRDPVIAQYLDAGMLGVQPHRTIQRLHFSRFIHELITSMQSSRS
jgi:AAA domain